MISRLVVGPIETVQQNAHFAFALFANIVADFGCAYRVALVHKRRDGVAYAVAGGVRFGQH